MNLFAIKFNIDGKHLYLKTPTYTLGYSFMTHCLLIDIRSQYKNQWVTEQNASVSY